MPAKKPKLKAAVKPKDTMFIVTMKVTDSAGTGGDKYTRQNVREEIEGLIEDSLDLHLKSIKVEVENAR